MSAHATDSVAERARELGRVEAAVAVLVQRASTAAARTVKVCGALQALELGQAHEAIRVEVEPAEGPHGAQDLWRVGRALVVGYRALDQAAEELVEARGGRGRARPRRALV